jgi:hypothetical protein
MAYRALPLLSLRLDVEQLARYVANEFQRISGAFEAPLKRRVYDATNATPDKADDGELRRSDGTNWATRFGAGLYFYLTADAEWKGLFHIGSGGTVAQATNKATGVTLNKDTGEITMNAAALAAGANVTFVLTNSKIRAGDLLTIAHNSGGTAFAYTVKARVTAAGSASINVKNDTAGSLSEAAVIRFTRIPGATA